MHEPSETDSPTAADPIRYPEPSAELRTGGVRGALKLFGPGAIIASVTIGSGETLFASRTGAIFGYALVWFIVVAAIGKLIQVYTAGRYMVLSGEHPMEAWARLPGPRGWFPAFLGGLSIFCFPFWLGGLAMMLGTALNWIVGLDTGSPESQRFCAQAWGTATLFLAAFLTLLQSYSVLERVQTFIVGILLVAILAALIPAPIQWLEAARSTVVVQWPEYEGWMLESYPKIVAEQTVLMVMVVFMGAIGGGTYDYIGYLSFYRDKRWGALQLVSPPAEDAPPASDAPDETPASSSTDDGPLGPPRIEPATSNLARGRSWIRAPMIDVFIGFACVLVFSIAFYLLGASILYPRRLVPDGFALLTPQVSFLTQIATPLKYVYQAGILMAFWGTIYGAFEIYSRTAYECFRPLFRRVRRTRYQRLRLPVCLYAGLGGLLLMWTVQEPLKIVAPAALIGTTTCGIWCFAMIWADRAVLPTGLRMSRAWIVLNLLAGTALTGFGGMAIWDYVGSLAG